jgi:hypothetical protein
MTLDESDVMAVSGTLVASLFGANVNVHAT